MEDGGKVARSMQYANHLNTLPDSSVKNEIVLKSCDWQDTHALREFLFVADKGVIRRKQEEARTNQAMCLNLITNAVVVWNTVYMQAVLASLRAEGSSVEEDDVAHLSPARFEHVNPYGKYFFPLEEAERRQGLRPLRAA